MRILCVIDNLGSGGSQRQLVNLAMGFKDNGHSVSFLVYHRENFYKDLIDRRGIHVNTIIETNYFKRFFKVRRFIRRCNCDVVLSYLEAPNFICELAGLPCRNWKLVVGERSANPDILRWSKNRIYRWFHILSDYVTTNSHTNLEMIRKVNPFLSAQKCFVISNMIDTEEWIPAVDYVPIKDYKFRLVIVSSHQYIKNANSLIESICLLENKKNIKVDWYGDQSPDNSYNEAISLIQKHELEEIITFHKATTKILDIIQHADAVGLFSKYEGLPNVICEAMACGKVVIASSVSDIPLHVKNPSLLCNPWDLTSIKSSIEYAMNLKPNTLKEIGYQNRLHAERTFSKHVVLYDYLKLINNNHNESSC